MSLHPGPWISQLKSEEGPQWPCVLLMLTSRDTKAGIHNTSWCLMGRIVSTVCGKPAVTGKIFGGQNAPDRRWPWQASLLYHGKHICGAALIDAYWVISAAHCFQKCVFPMGPMTWVGLGREHKMDRTEGGE